MAWDEEQSPLFLWGLRGSYRFAREGFEDNVTVFLTSTGVMIVASQRQVSYLSELDSQPAHSRNRPMQSLKCLAIR